MSHYIHTSTGESLLVQTAHSNLSASSPDALKIDMEWGLRRGLIITQIILLVPTQPVVENEYIP